MEEPGLKWNAKGCWQMGRERRNWKNHNFVTILSKVGSGKSHQWMQNLKGNLDEELAISMALKCFPTDRTLVIREKIKQ